MALIAEHTTLDSALQFYSVVLANNAVSSEETPAGVCVNSLSTCGESLKLAKLFRKNDEGAVITGLHPATCPQPVPLSFSTVRERSLA